MAHYPRIATILFILLSISFVHALGVQTFSPDLKENTRYQVVLPYSTPDVLFAFEKNGSGFQLYSNCTYIYGCNYFGLWNNPFSYRAASNHTYTVVYTQSTVINTYRFTPQSNGTVKVYASHDQCYPSGCQNPPLKFVGTYVSQ